MEIRLWKCFPAQGSLPVFSALNREGNLNLRDQPFVTAAFASGRPDATFLTGLCQ